MSRSKSPETMFEKKLKHRVKSIGSNQLSLAYAGTPAKLTNLSISSNKNRLSSIPNIRSMKHLKPKRSLKSLKSPLSKSPSGSVIHTTKEEVQERYLNPLTIRTENLKKIDEIMKIIAQIDQESNINSEINKSFTIDQEKFELFSKMFEEIIDKDKQYSKYLLLIKKFLNAYYEDKTEKLLNEINYLKKEKESTADKVQKEKHSLQRTVETLSRENIQLSKDLEKCEEHILMMQEQLEIIHKFEPEEMPRDLDNWKCLVLENKFYADLCKSMKKEIEVYKQNQELFLAKFDELKSQGIDVSYEFSECFSSSVESSVDFRDTKVLNKDKSVPDLNMSKIKNSSHLF